MDQKHDDDIDRVRTSYSALRVRIIAERERELARIASSQRVLRRIEKELAELEHEQRQLEGGQ